MRTQASFSTASDVAGDARAEERSDKHAVDDVPRPQPGKLERPDEPQLLPTAGEILCVSAGDVYAVTEERGRYSRLGLQLGCFAGGRHVSQCFT